ncbi:MAG: hypothetical protein NUV82_00985, partial [Candidatus Komeilibacteria bacterium]|nr:hypothetical protein [Candidatus Komeilibacteria bacterium]
MPNINLGNFLTRIKKYLLKRRPSASVSTETDDFDAIDQQTVPSANGGRIPGWQQFKQLPKVLSPVEQKVVRITSAIILICIMILLVSFYWSHTVILPAKGGDYTEGLVGAPNYINPLLAQYNDVDRDLSRLVFSGLLKYDEQGDLTLDLAEALEISPDQKQYTFKIRSNVLWHDGEEL